MPGRLRPVGAIGAIRPRVAIIAAAVLVAAALIAVGVDQASSGGSPAIHSSLRSGTPKTAHGIRLVSDRPASAPGAHPCTVLTVLTSLENADMVRALASAYAMQPRDVDGHCVTVTTTSQMSGLAEAQAAHGFAGQMADQRPDVWLPDSSAWLRLAADSPVVPSSGPSIAQSAVVLAMPVTLAMALGWVDHAPTWAEIFRAAENPDTWKRLGHPGWGTFKIGKASPELSTSGLLALAASYRSVAGDPGSLTAAQVDSSATRAQVAKSELPTAHYMSAPQQFLFHAREAEQDGSIASFLSAMFMDETTVWDYNRGVVPTMASMGMTGMGDMPGMSTGGGATNGGMAGSAGKLDPPKEKLVPIYPRDGVYVADNPVAVLHGSWVSAQQAAAAKDFVRFARSVQGQQVVRANGYRDILGRSSEQVTHVALTVHALHALPTPGTATLAALQRSFPQVRKPARVLFLLDVSGSMNFPIRPNVTRLQAAKKAIADALSYFNPSDRLGLAAFSNRPNGPITPGLVSPVRPLGSSRQAFLAALHKLKPVAQTPLYAAVDHFVGRMAAGYRPNEINAVVVLSDGHDHGADRTTRMHMLHYLAGVHRKVPILTFTLGYGHQADTGTLQAIATATGAHFFDATNPATVKQVLADELVTSF